MAPPPADPSDEPLAARAAAGDEAAFAELVGRWSRRVHGLAARFFPDPDVVDDVAQEAFLAAWRGLPRRRPRGSFGSWLMAITANACRDELRRRARRPRMSADGVDPARVLADGASPDPLRVAAARQAAARLLKSLSPEDRVLLVLLEVEGCSTAEAARMTSRSRVAVKVAHFRARRKLRALLEARHDT